MVNPARGTAFRALREAEVYDPRHDTDQPCVSTFYPRKRGRARAAIARSALVELRNTRQRYRLARESHTLGPDRPHAHCRCDISGSIAHGQESTTFYPESPSPCDY